MSNMTVGTIVVHQCMLGHKWAHGLLAKKPTVVFSNSNLIFNSSQVSNAIASTNTMTIGDNPNTSATCKYGHGNMQND